MNRVILLCIIAVCGSGFPMSAQNKLTVNVDQGKDVISKHINIATEDSLSRTSLKIRKLNQ